MRRKCPHAHIVDCPLYHAMHVSYAPSCDSGRLDEGLCKVDLGASYDAILMAVQIFDMRIVAECQWNSARTRETVH